MKFYLGLILFSSFLMKTSSAKTLEIKKDGRTIFIQEKTKWEMGKDLFGIPYIYFSPNQNGQRSNISFTDTGANLELDFKSLKDNQEDFKKNKKEWAQTVGATIESFTPFEMNLNKLGHKVHQIGLTYKHENKIYIEKSLYIECRGRIIFSKSLRLKLNESHEKDFSDLISGLDCGGV